MKNDKFITSHKTRVLKAKEQLKNWFEKVSIFDREAFVEYYLLEDIIRLYEYKVKQEKKIQPDTVRGQMLQKENLRKFESVLVTFKSIAETCYAQMRNSNYKIVWKNIPEGVLMKMASKVSYLNDLIEMSNEMFEKISSEAIQSEKGVKFLKDSNEDLKAHAENTRNFYDLPNTEEELKEVIASVLPVDNTEDNKTKKGNIAKN